LSTIFDLNNILSGRPPRKEDEDEEGKSQYESELKKMKVSDLKIQCRRHGITASKY